MPFYAQNHVFKLQTLIFNQLYQKLPYLQLTCPPSGLLKIGS